MPQFREKYAIAARLLKDLQARKRKEKAAKKKREFLILEGFTAGDLEFDKDTPLPNWDLKPTYVFDLLPKQVIEPTMKVVAKPVPIIAASPKPAAPAVVVPLFTNDAAGEEETSPSDESACHLM